MSKLCRFSVDHESLWRDAVWKLGISEREIEKKKEPGPGHPRAKITYQELLPDVSVMDAVAET